MPLPLFAKGFRKIGRGFERVGRWFDPPPPAPVESPQRLAHIARLEKWYAIDGDQNLRLKLDLSAESVVFDLGGYDGSVAVEIYARYGCPVWVFEPCPSFFADIHKRLHRNPAFKLFPFGLAGTSRTETISLDGAGTSTFRATGRTEVIELRAAADFFAEQPVPEIDLLKVNIEGGEYELLDHMIETGLIRRVKELQVQFHEDVLPDADRRMRAIQTALGKSHRLNWQHEWVWESWSRNEWAGL